MTTKENDKALPPGVAMGEDGKLRWDYTINLWRQPVLLYTAIKVMSIIAASFGLLVCFVRMGMDGVGMALGFLWRYLLIAAAVVLVLMGVSYLIRCLLYKGRYAMRFEMDEAGVLHTEEPRQWKKSRKIGAAAGTAAGYPGAMGLVATGQSFYSRFAEVKSVRAGRKQNLRLVNSGFVRNKIYAAPEQFELVWAYITSHCPKGKIYE